MKKIIYYKAGDFCNMDYLDDIIRNLPIKIISKGFGKKSYTVFNKDCKVIIEILERPKKAKEQGEK